MQYHNESKYTAIGDSNNQFSTRDITAQDSMMVTKAAGGDAVVTLSMLPIQDNISKKEYILYASATTHELAAGENLLHKETNSTGNYHAIEINRYGQSIKDDNILKNIGLNTSTLKEARFDITGPDATNWWKEAKETLSPENVAELMTYSQSQKRIEVAAEERVAPTIRDTLKAHFELQELIEVHKYKDESTILNNEHKKEVDAHSYYNLESMDEYDFKTSIKECDEKLKKARDAMMRKSLMPQKMMVVDGKLLDEGAAQSYTNNRFAALRSGEFMSLGDVAGTYEIGKVSNDPVALAAWAESTPASDYYKNVVIEDVVLIRNKNAPAEQVTQVSVIKNKDNALFVQAVAVDKFGVLSRNAESFSEIGINPVLFDQGVKDKVAGPMNEFYNEVARAEALAQISANNLREMVSATQIQNHYIDSDGHDINEFKPRLTDGETIDDAYVDAAYNITKFTEQQLADYNIYGSLNGDAISDWGVVTGAYLIETGSNQKSIVASVSRMGDSMLLVDHYDKDGRKLVGVDWAADAAVAHMGFNGKPDPTPNEVREMLKESDFFNHGWHDEEIEPVQLAAPFGDYERPHDVIIAERNDWHERNPQFRDAARQEEEERQEYDEQMGREAEAAMEEEREWLEQDEGLDAFDVVNPYEPGWEDDFAEAKIEHAKRRRPGR